MEPKISKLTLEVFTLLRKDVGKIFDSGLTLEANRLSDLIDVAKIDRDIIEIQAITIESLKRTIDALESTLKLQRILELTRDPKEGRIACP